MAKDKEQTWWRVSGTGRHPQQVRVVGYTDKTVVLVRPDGRNRRANRAGAWERFFPTWEAARQDMIDRATERCESLESMLSDANDDLERARAVPIVPPPTNG